MKKILLILFVLITVNGLSQRNAQDRAEDAVKKYLTEIFTKEKYKPFGFEPLFKITPPEIMEVDVLKMEVDELRKSNKLTDTLLKEYEIKIKSKVDSVKAKKVFSTYDIKHYFVVKDEGVNYLYYFDFILYPDGKVKDVTKLMKYEFVNIEYDWFYSYYRRSPLIIDNNKENKDCFTYLNDLVLNDTIDRESTMATTLSTYGVISRYGFMDTTKLSRIIILNELVREFGKEVTIIKYSQLKPVIDNGETIGYKQFVEWQKDGVNKAHYYELDLNYVIRGDLVVEAPYQKYFEEK